jgi:type IX secretion system PorP/SprF family membrane protein
MRLMRVIIFIIVIGLSSEVLSQDTRFSQFFNNTLFLSPAATGSVYNEDYMGGGVFMGYRNQWSKMNEPFQSLSLSGEWNVSDNFGNLGILINQDQAGASAFRCLSINALYAYSLPIDRSEQWNARFGLQVGLQNSNLNFNKLRFEDQIDPMIGVFQPTQEGLSGQSESYFNTAVSGIIHNENIHLGYSLHNLNTPEYQFLTNGSPISIPMRHTVFAGWKISSIGEQLIHLDFIYVNQKKFHDFMGGIRFNFGSPEFGFFYRRSLFNNSTSDAFTFLLGANFGRYKISYSGDFTTSELSTSLPFSSEISVKYHFDNSSTRNYRNIRLPIF